MSQLNSLLRTASWIVGAASLIAPIALLAHELASFNAWAEGPGSLLCAIPLLCGLSLFAIWLLAIALCALLSIAASVLNGVHLLRTRPASLRRYLEFALIACPAVICTSLVLLAAVSL